MVGLALNNATDLSVELCKQVVDSWLYRDILKYLNDPKMHPDLINVTGIPTSLHYLTGILYNVVTNCDAARMAYREASAVDILHKFRLVKDSRTKCMITFVLAYIVSEEENGNIHEFDDDNIALVINMLQQGYKLEKRRSSEGTEQTGEQRLEQVTIGSQSEQRLACQGLWRLAFKCSELIKQEPGCVDGTDGDQRHIMISYQWDRQDLLKRIRDKLKEAGYKVWMDVDHMTGSTLDAMAKAVEDASVVLIAASHKYKESNNCNAEAQYAHTLRRTIIPLIVEPHYEPDGWLGMLVRPRLYFNFAKDEQFDSLMARLVKEIERQ
ncbi:hypothetical protein LSAT2_009872 [Lamellibrachia satsuma]|nr:hypothetical protein LSAT2_009872 [Lamellibrachia satsuma]